MQVTDNTAVYIDYTLSTQAGKLIESSRLYHGPLAYLHGAGRIVSGLEKQLTGRNEGDKFTFSLTPDEAYGNVLPERIQVCTQDKFAHIESLHQKDGRLHIKKGMEFYTTIYDENPSRDGILKVIDVNDDKITVDSNHPLAGVYLTFEVEVLKVRVATPEEIEHGHIHDKGGLISTQRICEI
jgi:FKBP-type peptidyl-prolyl cis-trans isomerase SlyD